MSQESVEVVRAIFTLWDNEESADQVIDPDIEFVNPPHAVEPGVRRGRTIFDKIREEMKEMWRGWRLEPERFVDAGEHLVIIGWVRGTSATRKGGRVPRTAPQPRARDWAPERTRQDKRG